MQRRILLAIGTVAVVVVLAVLVVVLAPSHSAGRLTDALTVLPGDAYRAEYVDVEQSRERLGFADLTSESGDDEITDYLDRAHEERASTSVLASVYAAMSDWPWNFADVDWEVSYTAEGSHGTLFKLRGDLDMASVVESFADHGYERSDAGEYPRFTAAKSTALAPLTSVVVVVDRQLLIAGPEAEVVLNVLGDDSAPLAENDVATALASGMDSPEFAVVAVGESSCIGLADLLGERASPEQRRALGAQLNTTDGYATLRPFLGHAAAISADDGETVAEALVAYGSDNAASADAGARGAFVTKGRSPINGRPYASLEPQVSRDGSLLRFTFGSDDAADRLPGMLRRLDMPWAICAPT